MNGFLFYSSGVRQCANCNPLRVWTFVVDGCWQSPSVFQTVRVGIAQTFPPIGIHYTEDHHFCASLAAFFGSSVSASSYCLQMENAAKKKKLFGGDDSCGVLRVNAREEKTRTFTYADNCISGSFISPSD